MKFLFPRNLFSKLISDHLPGDLKPEVTFLPASVLAKELQKEPDAVGLMPAMDLVSNKELFVSKKYGLSFEGLLSNSYLYYTPEQNEIKDIFLSGDISSQEAVLSKILFKELYDTDIQVHLLTDNNLLDKNIIISGDENFIGDKFIKGISFSDEIIENLNLPYVNFAFAATGKESLETFHSQVSGLGEKIYNDIETYNFGKELSEIARDYIRMNISSMIIDFNAQDLEGLEQLIRLPYYYGMIESIVEIKYV